MMLFCLLWVMQRTSLGSWWRYSKSVNVLPLVTILCSYTVSWAVDLLLLEVVISISYMPILFISSSLTASSVICSSHQYFSHLKIISKTCPSMRQKKYKSTIACILPLWNFLKLSFKVWIICALSVLLMKLQTWLRLLKPDWPLQELAGN